jgi:hypothetical protein
MRQPGAISADFDQTDRLAVAKADDPVTAYGYRTSNGLRA